MPICLFHKIPIKEDPYWGMACVDCIEEAALRSALNMGPSNAFYCGHCGEKFGHDEMIEHSKKYPYGTCY